MSLRPTRIEVNLENLASNFRAISGSLSKGCSLMAVVKANGYGLGATRVARVFQETGCQRFAVATPDEAVELRENGINEPLLVLGPSPREAAGTFVGMDITAACTDISFAEAMSREAVAQGKTARLHIKIDTGMGRIGFLPTEVPQAVEKIQHLPGVDLEGIFTHFACADERNPEYTWIQFGRFGEVLDTLRSKNVRFRIRHVCNSAGTVNFPDMHLDAVRPGLILYGMWPSDYCRRSVELKPVFEVKTSVAVLRELPPLSGVGYGLRYVTRGAERVAVLPIGYHDGLARPLSMKASVLIRGKRAPLVGSICMDQTMVDVTHIPDVIPGDEVVIVGNQGEVSVTPEEIAGILGTINYEIPSLFTPRVPRVYV